MCGCEMLQLWWDTAPASLRATLWMLLADLPPDLPLLLFATADAPISDLDQVSHTVGLDKCHILLCLLCCIPLFRHQHGPSYAVHL